VLTVLLGPRLPDASSGSPDLTTHAALVVPYAPGMEMSCGSSPPLDITREVLNCQTPFLPNPILHQNANQNIVTSIQHFTSHNQCVE